MNHDRPEKIEGMTKPKRVLFVCVENSCRSQMAEAFARIHGHGLVEPYSAGSHPSGHVNLKAIEMMREVGYDMKKHRSKPLSDIPDVEYDFVVTMGCGDQCPFVRAKWRENWEVPDPKCLPPDQFRQVRDIIHCKVQTLLERLIQPHPSDADTHVLATFRSEQMSRSFKLTISRAIWVELVAAAGKAAPLEACGLLAGRDGKVTKFYPLTNVDASPEHFSMKPEEQFAAVKDMRRTGLQILAIWHSHPSSPPRMSEEDLRLAYTPDIVYVILSLAVSQDAALGGYRITNGVPEQVKIIIKDN